MSKRYPSGFISTFYDPLKTPNAPTIQALAELLGVPHEQTAKAVFFADRDDRLIVAIVRGDDDVEETKLTNAIGARDLRPAREEEIVAANMVPGYASPIGAKGALVVVDELVASSANLVAGANKEGYHFKNVNIPVTSPQTTWWTSRQRRRVTAAPPAVRPFDSRRGSRLGISSSLARVTRRHSALSISMRRE